MVDAAIELVVHPAGAVFAEEHERLLNEVVIVQEPAPVFFGLVAGDHRVRDREQRACPVTAHDGFAELAQRQQTVSFLNQSVREGWKFLRQALRQDGGARREIGVEENLEIDLYALSAGSSRGGR